MRRIYILLRYRLPLYIVQLLTAWLPNFGCVTKIRGFLIKPFLKSCGKKLRVASGVIINNSESLDVGDNVYLAHNVWINAIGGCFIGSNVQISPMVVISTSNHTRYENTFYGPSKKGKVIIGSGCWIASHSTITSGVTIGSGSLIAANSVVTGDIEEKCFAGGVPAKKIKFFND